MLVEILLLKLLISNLTKYRRHDDNTSALKKDLSIIFEMSTCAYKGEIYIQLEYV